MLTPKVSFYKYIKMSKFMYIDSASNSQTNDWNPSRGLIFLLDRDHNTIYKISLYVYILQETDVYKYTPTT